MRWTVITNCDSFFITKCDGFITNCDSTHVQTCYQPDLLQERFDMAGKTRNIAFELVLQHCCMTICIFFCPFFRTLRIKRDHEHGHNRKVMLFIFEFLHVFHRRSITARE